MPQATENRTAVETQRDYWNSVASAWAEWWPVIEAGARPVSEAMVELAEIGAGDRVLDLASGIGEPAATAARRAEPGGYVVATDLAPDMIERGRARARSLPSWFGSWKRRVFSSWPMPPASARARPRSMGCCGAG